MSSISNNRINFGHNTKLKDSNLYTSNLTNSGRTTVDEIKLVENYHANSFIQNHPIDSFHTKLRENKGEWFGMMYLLGAIRRL